MQVNFGKGSQTEDNYVRWYMRMTDEYEVGAWERGYD